jgi:transposase-like protein
VTPATPRKPRTFSEEDKQAALRLAATIGLRAASRELDISKSVLHNWKKAYPQLWSDLRAGNVDKYQQNFANRLEELADEYADVEALAAREAFKRIKKGQTVLDNDGELVENVPLDAKELAALIKALSSGRANAVLNTRAVRGEPTERIEHTLNIPALETAMEQLLAQAPPVKVLNEAEQDG